MTVSRTWQVTGGFGTDIVDEERCVEIALRRVEGEDIRMGRRREERKSVGGEVGVM